MVTADTITDDQLRELSREAEASGNDLLLGYCEVALSRRYPTAIPFARAQCAQAFNALHPPPSASTFDRLVKRVHADDQVKATIDEPELAHVLQVALKAMGFYVIDGKIHDEKPPEVTPNFEFSNSRHARQPRRGRR